MDTEKDKSHTGTPGGVMEGLPLAVYTDAGAECSQLMREFLGLPAEDARRVEEALFALMHPDDRPVVRQKLDAARAGGEVYYIECRIQRPGGQGFRWVLLEGRYFYDEKKRPLRHAGVVLDVDEHFLRERKLAESAERYRQIAETLSDYVYTVRVKNGVAIETIHSGACQAVTGYQPADFAKNPNLWIEMVHAHDRQMVAERAQKMLRGEAVERLEHRIIHKNGRTRWVSSTIVPHRDDNGEITYFDGVIRDITKEKLEEENAQQKHYINEILLNSVPYASVLLDDEGEVLAVNDPARKLGFAPGVNWEPVWKGLSGGDDALDVIERVIAKNERQTVEISNGKCYYETTFVPMEPDLCLACFYDIIKRKTFEKAMRNSRQLADSVINSDQSSVIILNTDLTIAAINPKLEKSIGLHKDELGGKTVYDIAPTPELAAQMVRMVEDVKNSGAPSLRDMRVNGRDISVHAIPVFDDDRRIYQVIFFGHDYSDRKNAESSLLEAYQMLCAMVEHSPAAIATFDNNHLLKTWNPAGEFLFGWKAADVCGRPSFWLDNLAPQDIAGYRARLDKGETLRRVSVNVQCKDGHNRQSFLTAARLLDANGAATGFLVIIEAVIQLQDQAPQGAC